MAGYAPGKGHTDFATVPQTDSSMDGKNHDTAVEVETTQKGHSSFRSTWIFWTLRYIAVVLVIGVPLFIPIVIFRDEQIVYEDESIEEKQYRQLVFYLFSWFEISWLGACVSFLFAVSFPYLFRFVARYVNPAHQRYWRVFRILKRPITLIGFIVACFTSFTILINLNIYLAVNINKGPTDIWWDDVIDDILEQCTLWSVFYLLEKILIVYITIHFHYRSNLTQISHSKDMQNALVALYEASVYLYPTGQKSFEEEDKIIRNASGAEHDESRTRMTTRLNKVGLDTYGVTDVFGDFADSTDKEHWFRPGSSYAVVERALSNPKSAAALGRRIWMSLVEMGKDALTAEDIAEVLGPFRREEALKLFKILDENESGDIQLDEMIWTVVEAGRIRHAIFQSMHDVDHNINTFDWIALLILAMVMVFFILVIYLPTLKEVQQTVGLVVIGLAAAVGRAFSHYLVGSIFVFFDHPFDVGDRVEVYNMQNTVSVSAVVTRQSLLYTVFRRIDNGTDMQLSNERLSILRVENVTRSGANKQMLSIYVDFTTSFKDISFLRSELEAFLVHPDNRRDYQPGLGLSITNLHELNKIELRCTFTHKSNWSNEQLRAARSMRFMCALLAAARKIPLNRPDGVPLRLGDPSRPNYTVMISDEESKARTSAEKAKRKAARWDAEPEETDDLKGNANSGAGQPLDLTSVQRGEADPEADRKKAEEAEAKAKQDAKDEADRLAEEAAMMKLSKLPAVPPSTRPTREEEGASTGIQFEVTSPSGTRTSGMRFKTNTGAENMFHR